MGRDDEGAALTAKHSTVDTIAALELPVDDWNVLEEEILDGYDVERLAIDVPSVIPAKAGIRAQSSPQARPTEPGPRRPPG